ncbi:MAG: hypothetical protein SPI30_01365 [Prevotella sp.]|nr:hypothetical protein [Prevotella sp.]
MKKKLLFAFIASMLLMPSSSNAQSSDLSTLISDKVEVRTSSQYHMFIKEYSQKVRDYLANNKRIAVEFVSKTPELLESGGAWFRGKKAGEGKMALQIYQEHPSFKDYPDYNNMLEEVPFDVVIKDEVEVSPLPLITEWGKKRADVIEKMTNELGYSSFTETYAQMNPTITPEEMAAFEVFYTGQYEFPLYYTFYNENNQLFSSDFIVSNFYRINDPEKSMVSKYLQENGFEYLGYDEQKWFVMYNAATKTQASCGLMIVQGQYFMYCMLQFSPDTPLGISDQKADYPTMDVKYNGNTIEVTANGQEGQSISIYSLNGQCLAKSTLKAGVNRFEMAKPMPVIIRAGNCLPVKMMP